MIPAHKSQKNLLTVLLRRARHLKHLLLRTSAISRKLLFFTGISVLSLSSICFPLIVMLIPVPRILIPVLRILILPYTYTASVSFPK